MGSLSPVAALAAGVEDQACSTVLVVGFSLAALIEVVLVGWVRVESVRLSSAKASAAAPAAAAAATARHNSGGMDRNSGGMDWNIGWMDWSQGLSAGWGEKYNN